MEEEVKLLYGAKLLEELQEVVSVEEEQPMSSLWELLAAEPGCREIKAGDKVPQG